MEITTRNAATLQRQRPYARVRARMWHTHYYRCIVAERLNSNGFNLLARNGSRNGEIATVAAARNARRASGLSRNGGKNRIKYGGKFA